MCQEDATATPLKKCVFVCVRVTERESLMPFSSSLISFVDTVPLNEDNVFQMTRESPETSLDE